MIRITVEMVPKGDDSRAWTMAQGVIANDGTGTETVGTYVYGFSGQAQTPGHDPGIRISGRLTGFRRKRSNVWHLIAECLTQGDQGFYTRDGTAEQ